MRYKIELAVATWGWEAHVSEDGDRIASVTGRSPRAVLANAGELITQRVMGTVQEQRDRIDAAAAVAIEQAQSALGAAS